MTVSIRFFPFPLSFYILKLISRGYHENAGRGSSLAILSYIHNIYYWNKEHNYYMQHTNDILGRHSLVCSGDHNIAIVGLPLTGK